MIRRINKVAVLGSGIMGSGIACHFANIGVETLLLDMPPSVLNDKEKNDGLQLSDSKVRNRIVNDNLATTLKSNPSPIYLPAFAKRIRTGNFEDNLKDIGTCDWVVEVIIENLEIKKALFEKVEKFRKPGSLITSNTSGIPLQFMSKGRSKDFQEHFCGTHFFNPPRYLQLLEIIPGPETKPDVVTFLEGYASAFLGKTGVICKDTPAFIANRIGIYSIMSLFHMMEPMGLTVDDVDKLTGPVIGRAKSATFRTCDVVGLDTIVHVAKGLQENCSNDEAVALFALPPYIEKMIEKNYLGSKTKQGFYKKIKDDTGNSEIHSLNLRTFEYEAKKKGKFPVLELTKPIDDLRERLKILMSAKEKAGDFYRRAFFGIFRYVSNRIPEISEAIYKIDDAMKSGFGWELGPFETWDAVGLSKTCKKMEENGLKPAEWIYKMLEKNITSFYKIENGKKLYYDIQSEKYCEIPGFENLIRLETIRSSKTIWKNEGATLTHLGDGILNLEFHTKMNTIGDEVIQGLNKAIDIAEREYKGLVISNDGQNFSAGANVALVFMFAIEDEFDELDFAVRRFQETMMRLRYSSIPVIAAPHGLTLGGGCELCMHADKVIAHAETYIGLVEFGVGIIPAGGGTKEFALRLSDEFGEGDIRINRFTNRFLTIGQAKVATSAWEAFDLGYLRKGVDEVIVSRAMQLRYAKQVALRMAEKGYTSPTRRNDITVLGKEGLGIVYAGASGMEAAKYISEHDRKISEKLGWVLCGGDFSQPTQVSEQYLLDLERKAFLELCYERKTLERLESLLKTGKILRN